MEKNKNGFISMTLVYTFLIVFLFLMLAILTAYIQKDKFMETIDSKISEDIGYDKQTKTTVLNTIISDNTPVSIDNEKNNIYLFDIANADFGNGNGLYYTTKVEISDENNDGVSSRMYFFRGTVENNHLIFAKKCWRIVRTNENGSIRLRYNGEPIYLNNTPNCPTVDMLKDYAAGPNYKQSDVSNASSETDKDKGVAVFTNGGLQDKAYHYASIGKAKFNENSSSNLGLKYVNDSNTFSPTKAILDTWFVNNLKNYMDYISPSSFCNDYEKQNSKSIVPVATPGSSKNKYKKSDWTNTVSLKCSNNENYTTTLDITGNKQLYYPIGLLSAQEIALAGGYLTNGTDQYKGGVYGIDNKNFYLYTGTSFWTMSPYESNETGAKVIYFDKDGYMQGDKSAALVSNSYDVIPVISINGNSVISSGKGTSNNPYIVR